MSKRVLVVYPDEGMLNLLKTTLSSEAGYRCEVETEENLKKALEAVESHRPDLLLMEVAPLDLGIGREEFQILVEIRQRYPDLKIILLIDFEEEGLIEKAKQLGVEDYSMKLPIEAILTLVGKKLGRL